SQQRRNPSLTVLVKHPDSNVRVYDGGQYETPCSRISHFGAISGCRIGPTGQPGVPPLRLRTFWLRLRSGLRLLPLPPSLLPSSILRLPRLPERVSLLKRTLGPPSPQRAAIATLARTRMHAREKSLKNFRLVPLRARVQRCRALAVIIPIMPTLELVWLVR